MNIFSHPVRKFFFILLFLLIAVPVFAETYYVGVSLPLSGKYEKDGQNMLNAIKMYFDRFNRESGPEGNKIEVIAFDDKDNPKIAEMVAGDLVAQDRLLGAIGGLYSNTAVAIAPIFDDAEVACISPFASNPEVTANSEWVFSVNYNDEEQGGFIAVYLKEVLKKDNVLAIHSNGVYGTGLRNSFVDKAGRIGLNVSRIIGFDDENITPEFIAGEFDSEEDAKKFGAVVIFAHTGKGMEILRQLREFGVEAVVMAPDTFSSKELLTNIGEKYTKDTYVTSPFFYELAKKKTVDFIEAYKKKYKEDPNVLAPMCYDAAMLLGEAIKAKGPDRNAIREYLASIDKDHTFDGLTGHLYFDENGSTARNIDVAEIKEKRFKVAFTQLIPVREKYVLEELDTRVAEGYILVADGVPYHIVDVVFVGIDFFRINEISIKDMDFDAELFMWFKWKSDNIDIDKIDIINGIYGVTDQKYVLKEDLSGPVKYRCYRVRGTYLTPYNLRQFPFDTQTLPILVAHQTMNSTHVMLALDTRHMTKQPVREIYPQEWKYIDRSDYSFLFKYDSTFGDPDYRLEAGYKSDVYFSAANFNIRVKRIIFPYLLTLFTPIAIIVTVTLLLFFVSIEHFAIRITSAMTALLSILVFQMAMVNSFPNVGYLIKADLYFLFAYIFIFAVIINDIFVNYLRHKGKTVAATIIDKIFFALFLPGVVVLYTALTLFFK